MDLQPSCILLYYGWVHGTAGALVCDSYLDGDGPEPSRTSCKPLMHCSHWTEKKASIGFDRNWATLMVNFARSASSSQRFAPSRLAEGEMRFFLQSEIRCSVRSRYMRPRWEMTPRCYTRTRGYPGRHFVQVLNNLFLRLIFVCVFFPFRRASSSKLIFISNSSFWKEKKKGFVFVAMSSSATIATLSTGSWVNGIISCLFRSLFTILMGSTVCWDTKARTAVWLTMLTIKG